MAPGTRRRCWSTCCRARADLGKGPRELLTCSTPTRSACDIIKVTTTCSPSCRNVGKELGQFRSKTVRMFHDDAGQRSGFRCRPGDSASVGHSIREVATL